jgi:hypothetical protein
MKKLLTFALGSSLLAPTLLLSDVHRECRGVAAGVVSSMRANNEIQDEEMLKAATLAARRACVAALEGFTSEDFEVSETGHSTPSEQSNNEKDVNNNKMSVWEFISQDQGSTEGHERLKKRRQ